MQIAALSSVALLTVELWPHAFAFASDLAKLIGITICECVAVAAFDFVYLWRLWHDDVPDAYQLLPSVLHAGDTGTRCAVLPDVLCADVTAQAALVDEQPVMCAAGARQAALLYGQPARTSQAW